MDINNYFKKGYVFTKLISENVKKYRFTCNKIYNIKSN